MNMFSPCHPGAAACDVAFTCYAVHRQAIEDVIESLVYASDPNDTTTQHWAFEQANIDTALLTEDEINYIENEVSRRRY